VNDSNQLNKFWMFCSSITKNECMITKHFDKWHTFIWSAKTLLKNQVMSFFAPIFPILLSKSFECNFIIKKINLIILIHTTFFMKKIQDSKLVPQNLVIYHTKHLCCHVKHILFYLWLKYGAIWINIANFVESFSIVMCSGTWFLSHLSWHLKTCFNHPNHKKSSPFQSRSMRVFNKKIY